MAGELWWVWSVRRERHSAISYSSIPAYIKRTLHCVGAQSEVTDTHWDGMAGLCAFHSIIVPALCVATVGLLH